MEINTSTYETIFLLYIDKELSQKEQLEVEAFIAKNPAYALLMEELKATVVKPETLRYPKKANLKKQAFNTLEEETGETVLVDDIDDWSQTYSNYLMEDMQAIPGLSTQFKNGLKKTTASKGILIRPFKFKQNKFTYAAIAAILMVFFGYQQLTKIPESNIITANTHSVKSNREAIITNEPLIKNSVKFSASMPNQRNKSIVSHSNFNKPFIQEKSTRVLTKEISDENILITSHTSILANQTFTTIENLATVKPNEIITSANGTNIGTEKKANPITSIGSLNDSEDEMAPDTNSPISYEIIDTDDPNRTIYIANFEIDGNRLRGFKRRVESLFKNNKSERNK